MNELNKRRIERIKKSVFNKPWIFSFILIFISYIGLNIWLNQNYVTLPVLFSSYRIRFVIPFLFFNFLLIPSLVATTINLSILKFKENSFGKKGATGGIASVGVFAGILGGACPGCLVGLFPAFLGIFGLSLTLSSLPLFGLEIQILSAGLLIWAILLLTKDPVCKIPIKK